MQRALLIKAFLICAIFLVLLIPLGMIGGIVAERQGRQQAVVQEIMSSSYGRQTFAGPVLSVPYVEEYDEFTLRDAMAEGREIDTARKTKIERRRVEHVLRIFPVSSDSVGDVGVATKRRGLFKARVFDWKAGIHGEFAFADLASAAEHSRPDSHIVWGKPYISFSVSDPRGLNGSPGLQWDGHSVTFERGSALPNMPNGLHAEVPPFDPAKPQSFTFALAIDLRGVESLSVVPVAAENKVALTSTWPHPSFGGQLLPLPESQVVTAGGFNARWDSSALALNVQDQINTLLRTKAECPQLNCVDRIEVRFMEPVDIYSMSDRAVKYGFLFIALTFACLALFELLKHLAIHPAQYLLGGLALATFFLLLISLSEHIPFGIAYLIASTACISLLGYYLGGVLRSLRLGVLFSTMLVALYSALYGLLISEDNALLLGALLVFGILAVAMITTRRIDWYALTPGKPAKAGSTALA